ncbi:uncharacterized protein LOC107365430 isoform X2 [Tetranychus urticae]|uniref:uncharacterized protein LOC107365430 isoform X2 n=1 Tax=Tetranychus urticae TaxID=32264 RepID=UPI00077BBC75|nr:uncharacterized protein LOC107365430 isoform X2 [Tetranychus urticae]
MAQQSNKPKITFKVKHFDEYHDIVIDWNEDRNRYNYQQVFDQLESITGVPSRYTSSFSVPRPDEVNRPYTIACHFYNLKASGLLPNLGPRFRYSNIESPLIVDGERYHLEYYANYSHRVSKRISMGYALVKERYVTDEAFSRDFCQHQCTESHFARLKDLVSNNEMSAKIAPLVQPLMERNLYRGAENIFREFNFEQYLRVTCVEERSEEIEENGNDDLYIRTRG